VKSRSVLSISLLLGASSLAACGQPQASGPADTPEAVAARQQVHPTYDKSTGMLTRLEADSDHDGLIDTWAYMDGARVVRVEVDENGDGTVDRWEYHKAPADGQSDQGKDQNAAGRGQSAQPVRLTRLRGGGFASPDKTIERIERATRHDGVVSRWEYFENGMLVRIDTDTDGDGKIDKWETYSDGSLSTLAIDTHHRGTPDRRLVYRPDGTLDRIEIDPMSIGTWQPMQGQPR